MVDLQNATINTALYFEKFLKFNAVLFDGLGGIKYLLGWGADKKKGNDGNEKRKKTERMTDKGFQCLKLSTTARAMDTHGAKL